MYENKANLREKIVKTGLLHVMAAHSPLSAKLAEEAGADMILVHSKQKTPDEIESFIRAWRGKVPIVIVPTAYPDMNEERIQKLGKVAIVIYGNHAIRASVTAMKDIFTRILKNRGIHKVNKDIVTVE